MKGYYHSIETFGTVDGNGIRYVLFLAGCALGCRFCHNPDTWGAGSKTVTVEEVLADYRRYRLYYEASGGGLTVSGGEPLLQPGFVASLFAACRDKGIHTTLDTAGYAEASGIGAVVRNTDTVLFGLKGALEETYNRLTNCTQGKIVDNLYLVSGYPVELIIRYILIPSVNDSERELEAVAKLITSLKRNASVELLPYHTMGISKWHQLGLEYLLDGIPPASDADILNAKSFLTYAGITVV